MPAEDKAATLVREMIAFETFRVETEATLAKEREVINKGKMDMNQMASVLEKGLKNLQVGRNELEETRLVLEKVQAKLEEEKNVFEQERNKLMQEKKVYEEERNKLMREKKAFEDLLNASNVVREVRANDETEKPVVVLRRMESSSETETKNEEQSVCDLKSEWDKIKKAKSELEEVRKALEMEKDEIDGEINKLATQKLSLVVTMTNFEEEKKEWVRKQGEWMKKETDLLKSQDAVDLKELELDILRHQLERASSDPYSPSMKSTMSGSSSISSSSPYLAPGEELFPEIEVEDDLVCEDDDDEEDDDAASTASPTSQAIRLLNETKTLRPSAGSMHQNPAALVKCGYILMADGFTIVRETQWQRRYVAVSLERGIGVFRTQDDFIRGVKDRWHWPKGFALEYYHEILEENENVSPSNNKGTGGASSKMGRILRKKKKRGSKFDVELEDEIVLGPKTEIEKIYLSKSHFHGLQPPFRFRFTLSEDQPGWMKVFRDAIDKANVNKPQQ